MARDMKDKMFKRFIEGLPRFQNAPIGFLSVNEYAERSNSGKTGIIEGVRKGRIPAKHCITVGKGTHLHINWNKTAYDFIASKQQRTWPSDFEPNEERVYKPIEDVEDEVALIAEETEALDDDEASGEAETLSDSDLKLRKVTDINSAKYRTEQLKILKAQAELRLANNETIFLRDAISQARQQGVELRLALQRAVNKLAPLLVGIHDVLQIRGMLERAIFEAIETASNSEERSASNGTTEEEVQN